MADKAGSRFKEHNFELSIDLRSILAFGGNFSQLWHLVDIKYNQISTIVFVQRCDTIILLLCSLTFLAWLLVCMR